MHSAEDMQVEAEVERALAPYVGTVSAEVLDEMRTTLRFALATHPVAQDLLRRLRPAPEVDESGSVAKKEPMRGGKAGGGAQ